MFSNNLEKLENLPSINTKHDIKNIHELFYDYNEKTLYRTEYEKMAEKDGFLKIPYISNTPNITITYPNKNVNYLSTNLYVFGIPPIKTMKCQGMIVIEHNPSTNGDPTLYTCFLLSSDPSYKKNSIDDLIIGKPSTTFNLNQMIKSDKTTLYVNGDSIAIVFDKPFYLASNLGKFTQSPNIFAKFVKEIPCFPIGNISSIPLGGEEGFISEQVIEGMKDIPVFCTPIDELGDATEFTDQIVIPAIGPLSENLKSIALFNYALDFIYFVIVMILAYFVIPFVYLYIFAAKLVEHKDKTELLDKSGDLVGVPFFSILFIVVILSVLLMTSGDGINNILYGGLIITMCVLSGFIIFTKPNPIYKPGFDFSGIKWFMDKTVLIGFIIGSGSGAFSFIGNAGALTNTIIMFFLGTVGIIIGKAFSPDNIPTSG